jgi:hypothetical protein
MAAGGGAWPSRRRPATVTRVVQRNLFGWAARRRGRRSRLGDTYSQCAADPVIVVCFARGAPGGEALRPGRGGSVARGAPAGVPFPPAGGVSWTRLGHGPLRRAAGRAELAERPSPSGGRRALR